LESTPEHPGILEHIISYLALYYQKKITACGGNRVLDFFVLVFYAVEKYRKGEMICMNAPAQIAENYAELGVFKARMPKGKLFLLAILAGVFIAAAGVGSLIGSAAAGKLAGACIFPAGLAMVVIAGSELFTGNNLMVISLLEKKITVGQLLLAWLVVYVGNLVGAMLVSWLTVAGGTFNAYYESLIAAAAAKTALSFGEAVLRGIMCNLLVCVAVWMGMAAKEPTGKIVGLFLPIMVFVLCGYEHCVANMFYIPAGLMACARYGVTADGLTWWAFVVKNLLPVTMGNIIGGAGLGTVFWAIYLPNK
jgi:formate/nitrite transporter